MLLLMIQLVIHLHPLLLSVLLFYKYQAIINNLLLLQIGHISDSYFRTKHESGHRGQLKTVEKSPRQGF